MNSISELFCVSIFHVAQLSKANKPKQTDSKLLLLLFTNATLKRMSLLGTKGVHLYTKNGSFGKSTFAP